MPLDGAGSRLWDVDCDTISDPVAVEMLRQAELRQEAIFRAALGMDQRAAVLSAAFAAAAGALVAAAMSITSQPAGQLRPAALTAGIVLIIASVLCALVCRPQKFRFPGINPDEWAKTQDFLSLPLRNVLVSSAAVLQDQMRENEAQQRRNGIYLASGMLVAAFAPAIAFAIWVLN